MTCPPNPPSNFCLAAYLAWGYVPSPATGKVPDAAYQPYSAGRNDRRRDRMVDQGAPVSTGKGTTDPNDHSELSHFRPTIIYIMTDPKII